MRTLLLMLGVGLLLGADTKTSDRDKIQGTWTVVSMTREGKTVTQAKGNQITFKDDKMSFRDQGGTHTGGVKLDPARKPAWIDLTPGDGPAKGKTVKGVYSLEDGKLTLCFPLDPTKGRPTTLDAKAGSGLGAMVLERKK